MYYIPKAEEIKKRRENMGLTAHKLSMNAGFGQNGIARMEKNLHKVHPLRAQALAKVMKCKVKDIFEEEKV